MSNVAYLDCHGGIDGNTLLAALLDIDLSLDTLKQSFAFFPLHDYHFALEHVSGGGIRGSLLTITSTLKELKVYSWPEIETLFSSTHVSEHIRTTTLNILRRIANAEAVVRGDGSDHKAWQIPASELLTLLGIVVALKELDITQLYASVLPLALTDTQNSYSQNAISSSIAVEILRSMNAMWKPTSNVGQVVTPIGAALLAALARFDTPTMTIERVGLGFASQSPSAGGSLRLYLGKLQGTENDGDTDSDWVTVLSTNIDNMSGEILGGLMDRLLAAGALDVSHTPIQMKKNRPATMLMVICPLEKGDEFAHVLLRETTTLGVRVQQVQRLKAQRTQQQIDTPLGPLLVKVKRLGSKIISASPEYEECQRLAHEHNKPLIDVYTITQHWISNTLFDGNAKSDI